MKLTYWLIECIDDSSAYDIREKTKREALERYHCVDGYGYSNLIEKITLEYQDGFDLMNNCCGEDRGIGLLVDKQVQKIGGKYEY